jgi:hypothetical protein
MKKAFIAAAALVVSAITTMVTAHAIETQLPNRCGSVVLGNICLDAKAPLTTAEQRYMLSELIARQYPGKIVVTNYKSFRAVKAGWYTQVDCKSLLDQRYGGTEETRQAKFVHCVFHQNGWPAPKPEIVKGY